MAVLLSWAVSLWIPTAERLVQDWKKREQKIVIYLDLPSLRREKWYQV